MRLFVSIDLSNEVKDHLFELQHKVKEAKINWVAKKNLHITLKFLGEVQEEQLPKIIEALKTIEAKSFSLSLTSLGFFPSKLNPKIMWVGIEPEDLVIQLQQKVDEVLLTIINAEQEFKAHVTIGRIKNIRRQKEFVDSINNIEVKPLSFTISSFSLMKSVLRRGNPHYEVIEHVNLS